jgi:hypothetical protein
MSEGKMEEHLERNHSVDESYACDVCPKVFMTKSLLR